MKIKLPQPKYSGKMSLEEAIYRRKSCRRFLNKKLSMEQISQILWAGQGITRENFYRTVPSAGALYPIELYAVMEEGVFHYIPHEHSLELIKRGDFREELMKAALYQEYVLEAPLDIVIAAVFERTTRKYGDRGIRYVLFEAGHVSQNIYLQCTALGLGTVAIGAFYDEDVANVLSLPKDHKPLYIMPVGYPRE